MPSLYQRDLAYVHAAAFETLARAAACEIVRRLKNSKSQIQKVMDVGCGAGPLTRTLVDVGFEVTGVDASAELLELARANVPSVQFVHGSAYDVPIRGYDAVAAVGEALTYHPEDAYARQSGLRFFRTRRHDFASGRRAHL